MQKFNFKYQRPLQVNDLQYLRVFEPLSGASEIIEDKAPRREFSITAVWTSMAEYKLLRKFVQNHYKREIFLFRPELDGADLQVQLNSSPNWTRNLNMGSVELTLQEVNPIPTDWENPTPPGISVTGAPGSLTVTILNVSKDNMAVTGYEIELRPPIIVP